MSAMDLPAFVDALDRYGAEPAAWPADVRSAAEPLLLRSAVARQAAASVAEIEYILRATSLDARGEAAGRGIDASAAKAMRHRQDQPASPLARPVARALFAACAALMLGLGLVVGWGTGEPDEGPDHALAVALDGTGIIDAD